MTLKEAFIHLIQGGWTPPNRMFSLRFKKGLITDGRLRLILHNEGYELSQEEIWVKKIVPNFKKGEL